MYAARQLLQTTVLLTMTSRVTNSEVEITVTEGKLVGFTKKLMDRSLTVDVFYGVPYAAPPVKQLRFKPPAPVVPWVGERSAKYLPNSCVQAESPDEKSPLFREDLLSPPTRISEDCLYLNLWVPQRPTNESLSTLVWFHGGGFAAGSASSSLTDGAYLAAERGVIVVSVNYRLGVLGFFYMGQEDADAKGNLGLLDQRMALEWINSNIEIFGGSRQDVTLFGVDAGAASVGFHLLSPQSWPFFSSAILQSGSPLSTWAMTSADVMLRKSRELAALAGCNQSDSRLLMVCMRELRAADILRAQLEFGDLDRTDNRFTPLMDGDFMGDNPAILLKTRKIKPAAILIGVNENDGVQTLMSRLPQHFPFNTSSIHVTRDVFIHDVIPAFLSTESSMQLKMLEFLYTNLVTENQAPISFYHASEALVSDVFFKCDIIDFAKAYYVSNDVYLYSFRHRVSTQTLPRFVGAAHYGEVELLFGIPFRRSWQYTREDMLLSQKMMELWSNFAKFGSPNPPNSSEVWPRYESKTRRHLVMTTETGLRIQTGLRRAQCSFLKELLPTMKAFGEAENKCVDQADSGSPKETTTAQNTGTEGPPGHVRQSHAHSLSVTLRQSWIYVIVMTFVVLLGL